MKSSGIETSETQRATLSIEETALVLGIGRSLAYQAARQGQIPVLRFGRILRVPRAALERMLSQIDLKLADAGAQEAADALGR